MIFPLGWWEDVIDKHGTSGDQVYDIIESWKADRAELEAENAKLKSQLAKNKELLAHVKYKLLTVSDLDADTIKRRTEHVEQLRIYITELEDKVKERNEMMDQMIEASNALLNEDVPYAIWEIKRDEWLEIIAKWQNMKWRINK